MNPGIDAAELLSPAGLAVTIPLLAAIALTLMGSWRSAVWVNVVAAALTLLCTCALPATLGQTGGLLLVDALAAHLAMLTAFISFTTALFSIAYVRVEVAERRLEPRRLRIYHAMYQLFVAGLLLALLANDFALTWIAIEVAIIASAVVLGLPRTPEAVAASWRLFVVCGAGMALALFGTTMLCAAAPPAMTWSALFADAARFDDTLLNLGFAFLLIGYGTLAGLVPLHLWIPDAQSEGPTPVSAVLAGSMFNVALFVILRLRRVMAASAVSGGGAIDPGPAIMALGLVSLLVAAFSMWRRGDVRRFFAFSTIGQNGLAAFAFGIGGPTAIFAGVLHMTLHSLANSAMWQCVGRVAQLKGGHRFADVGGLLSNHRGLGLSVAACIVALAALPPFGLFASEFLIVVGTIRRVPLLAVPLGVGIVVIGWALIAGLQALCLGAPTPDRGAAPKPFALFPTWLHLGLVAAIGLTMPAFLWTWFQSIAEGAQ